MSSVAAVARRKASQLKISIRCSVPSAAADASKRQRGSYDAPHQVTIFVLWALKKPTSPDIIASGDFGVENIRMIIFGLTNVSGDGGAGQVVEWDSVGDILPAVWGLGLTAVQHVADIHFWWYFIGIWFLTLPWKVEGERFIRMKTKYR